MPSRDQPSDLLARTQLFSRQPAEVLEATCAVMRQMHFPAGCLIFGRGDPGDALFLMLSGRVRLSILTPEGRELSFAHATAGDIFGEIAVLDGSPRSADATAIDDVAALCLPGCHFNTLIEQHASLAQSVIRFLCWRLREVSDHLEDIALLPLEARIARFLLNRASTHAVVEGRGDDARRITLGISQSELALLIGASRQKVNAALMLLEHTGAIKRMGSDYRYDRALLQQIAQRSAEGE